MKTTMRTRSPTHWQYKISGSTFALGCFWCLLRWCFGSGGVRRRVGDHTWKRTCGASGTRTGRYAKFAQVVRSATAGEVGQQSARSSRRRSESSRLSVRSRRAGRGSGRLSATSRTMQRRHLHQKAGMFEAGLAAHLPLFISFQLFRQRELFGLRVNYGLQALESRRGC